MGLGIVVQGDGLVGPGIEGEETGQGAGGLLGEARGLDVGGAGDECAEPEGVTGFGLDQSVADEGGR